MENFFKKLCDCEQAVLSDTSYVAADEKRKAYSSATAKAVEKLVAFVEAGDFTKAKCSKFIARHFRYNTDALTKLWNRTYGANKSSNTMRSQVSVTSMALYSLFGTSFADDLLADNPTGVLDALSCFEVGDMTFDDIFIYEIADMVDKNTTKDDYELSELTKEIKVLQRFRRDRLKKHLQSLDISKVAFIKRVLDKPLVVDHKISEEKVELLKSLHQLSGKEEPVPSDTSRESLVRMPDNVRSPQNIIIPESMFKLITSSVDMETKVVNDAHVQELKAMLYLLYTQEGITKYFSKFSGMELGVALKQIKEGN